MTDDEMKQALREFRPGAESSNEGIRQTAYAYATRDDCAPGRRGGTSVRILPAKNSARLIAAVGALALLAVAAMAATGVFAGDAGHTTRRPMAATGEVSAGPMQVAYSRNAGALNSIALTLNPRVAQAKVELQVLHSNATDPLNALRDPSVQVVYQAQVPTTTPPAAMAGPSYWSGTLTASDWSGGCQPGLYRIKYTAIPSTASFADPNQGSREFGDSEWFSCAGG